MQQRIGRRLWRTHSVSHLGFCTLGNLSMNPNGIAGSVMQQLNHGIRRASLFLIIGVIYERRHTREISEYGRLGARDAEVRPFHFPR